MKIFRLINKNGYVTNEFRAVKYKDLLEGNLYEVDSWDDDDTSIPNSYTFISSVSVKWDLCSHWEFEDNYSHICGGFGYIDFIRGMAFVVELVKMNIDGFDEEYNDYQYFLNLNLLEGCKIIEINE